MERIEMSQEERDKLEWLKRAKDGVISQPSRNFSYYWQGRERIVGWTPFLYTRQNDGKPSKLLR
jgi:hypothetical protein